MSLAEQIENQNNERIDNSERMDNQSNDRQVEMNRDYNGRSEQQDLNDRQQQVSDSNSGTRRSNRGFAAMSPERQKQIASEGGRAAHRLGVAHEWNSDEARRAGKKGGQIVSQNREHMSEIGRRGGQSSGGRRNRQQENTNTTESSE
jgi:general stress protein YciG